MLRLEKELECNAAEQSDAYRMHSSARPARGRGASRLLTAPDRSLDCSYSKLLNDSLEPWGDVKSWG